MLDVATCSDSCRCDRFEQAQGARVDSVGDVLPSLGVAALAKAENEHVVPLGLMHGYVSGRTKRKQETNDSLPRSRQASG